jgi:PAS domain S-box-containing protein
MVAWARRWLVAPVVGDAETTRTANLLHTIALASLIGLVLFVVLTVSVGEHRWARIGTGCLIIALEIAVLVAVHRSHVAFASRLQTFGLWGILTGYSLALTGITFPGFGAFFVLVAMASLLLDRRTSVQFTGVVLSTTLLLAVFQARGVVPLYPLGEPDLIASLAIQLLLITMMAVLMQIATSLLNQALSDQAHGNRALEASRASLEAQVADRTAELSAVNAQLRQEVDERSAALEALQVSEEKHRLLLDSIRTPVLALNADMSILYCNDAYAEMVDTPMDRLEGRHLVELFPLFARTRSFAAFQQAIATGEPQTAEGEFVDGHYFQARVYPTPWGILSIAEDITERRRADIEREQFASQLRTAAETASRLSTILDPEDLVRETVDLVRERFDLYHVHLYLLDGTTGELVVRAGSGSVGRELEARGHRIPLGAGQSLVARAGASGQVVSVADVQSEPGFLPNAMLPETRSEVAVPLVTDHGLIGVLDVQDDQPGRFTAYDIDTFVTLAGQIAVAIEKARLFHDQQRTQEELRDARQRLHTLLESLPQVLLYETGGGREAIIGNTQAMFGYPIERFVEDRRFFPSLIHPDDSPRLDQGVAEWNASGKPDVLTQEFRSRRADGREIWIRDYMVGVKPEGGLPYMAGVLLDVTERREAEEERLRFIEQLRTAAEVGESLKTLLDPDALVHETVQLMRERFGLYHVHLYIYDKHQDALVVRAGSGEVGARLVASGHRIPLDAPASIVAQAALREELIKVDDVRSDARFLPNPLLPETRSELALPLMVRQDLIGVLDVQDNHPARFTAADLDTFRILAGQIAIALENARVFEELKRVAERLKEVDRLKSEFLANMSHELRTPLNSIIGYAELILMGINGEQDAETQQDVQAIFDNGQQLLMLINDVLDLAKIEAGRMRLEMEDMLVGPLLDEVRTSNAGLLLKKPIEMSIEVESALPAIRCDRLRVQQILNNLVSNAVKFTDRGHIWLRAYREGAMIAIEVEDTGAGIGDEDLGTIFEKFRQADGSYTRRARGTGLGLAITHHLVKLHHGRIDVRSQVGVGTTFTVRLPIHAHPFELDVEPFLLAFGQGEPA